MRTIEERRAYQRGYSRSRVWPDHAPPLPPNHVVAAIIKAARELRDKSEWWLTQLDFDDNDPCSVELLAGIDAVDSALKSVTAFLLSAESLGKSDGDSE